MPFCQYPYKYLDFLNQFFYFPTFHFVRQWVPNSYIIFALFQIMNNFATMIGNLSILLTGVEELNNLRSDHKTLQEHFNGMDTNSDGILEPAEFDAYLA